MNKLKFLIISFFLTPTLASATTGMSSSDNFYKFYEFINNAVTGGLGIGIALTSLLVGAGIGAAKSSAMPAIAGIVLASIIGFGPGIIVELIASGTLI